jgi:hypothetical protein
MKLFVTNVKHNVTLRVLSVKIYIRKKSHRKDHTKFISQFPIVFSSNDVNHISNGEQILKKHNLCLR